MKKKQGFTLIELIVSVTIIAIIAIAVIPKIRDARRVGYATQILADLKAIESALFLAAADEGRTIWRNQDDFFQGNIFSPNVPIRGMDSIEDIIIEPTNPKFNNSARAEGYRSYRYLSRVNPLYANTTIVDPYRIIPFVNPADCFNPIGESFTRQQLSRLYRGVNIIRDFGISSDSERRKKIFEHLDNKIDGGDGPLCGRMRGDAHGYTYNFNVNAPTSQLHRMIYSLSFDGKIER